MHIASLLLTAILAYILLVVHPFPILHDYPEWMYQGHVVFTLLTDGNGALTELFEWVPVPVPNSITHVSIGALNFLVTPVMAGKIWLGVYFLLVAITAMLATRYHRHGGTTHLLFAVTVAFGPGFWNGYINFQFGLLFFALFVVLGLRRNVLLVLFFSLLIYFSHASVFAGFICYVILSERVNERRASIATALLPSLGLLMWYTSAKLLEGGGQNISLGSVSQWLQYKLYTLAKQGPFHNFIRPDGESLLVGVDSLYLLGFVANFVVAALLGVWFLILISRLRKSEIESFITVHAGLFSTVVVLMVGWLIAGKNSFGVVNLGERFLIVALMLLILCEPCPLWLRRCWLLLCGVFAVVTVSSLLVISQYAQQSYTVSRSGDSTELTEYVDDIYQSSRHKFFNHRLFIYANLGQYLVDPSAFEKPPLFDHESSIVRMKSSVASIDEK